MTDNVPHTPVLLQEVLADLQPQADKIYVDATFGAGGYTKAVLAQAPCQVYGLDRDPNVLPYAQELERAHPGRFHFLRGKFSQISDLLRQAGLTKVDGIMLDIGVSSMQLDQAERGFSFQQEAPLDMRMDNSNPDSFTAQQVVNTFGEKQLADLIYNLGDEYLSHKIAKNIVTARKQSPITTTLQLANLVRAAYPASLRHKLKIDPATKTFQAIRIFINQELEELQTALEQTPELLNPGGRLVVVTFHSLEDRIVKNFLQRESGHFQREKRNKYKPMEQPLGNFTLLHKKPIQPGEEELQRNIRSRSAKLRTAIRN